MAKFNPKKFEVGYQKDDSSAKQTAGEMFNEFKDVSAKENALKAKYQLNVMEIPYEDILPNELNRDADRDIDKLADSILTFGLIHPPRVKAVENGKYVITSGERRWRAIGKIRETHPEMYRTITCTVGDIDSDELDEEARLIIANNDVCDPTPEEYRKSIERLCAIYEAKKARGDVLPAGIAKTIAQDLSMTPRQVQKMISINQKLIPELQEVFDKQGITIDKASNIAQLDPIYQEEILELFNQKGDVTSGDIAYFRAEDAKLREENADQKAELDRLRAELKKLRKNSSTSETADEAATDTEESKDKQAEVYENVIAELKKAIKNSSKPTPDKSDTGKHMLFQDTIARLERVQNNALRQAKDIELDDIERKRITDVIQKLNSLL